MEPHEIVVLENSLKYLSRDLAFPKKNDRIHPGKAFYGKYIAINLSTVMLFAGCMLHLIVNIKKQTYNNLDQDMAVAISIFGSYVFNSFYVKNVQSTIDLYRQLSDFDSYGIPNNFVASNRRLNFLSKCHYFYIMFVIFGFCSAPLLDIGNCKQRNIEKNIHEICGFVGGIWLPFELETFPYRQMYYLYQVYSAFVVYHASSLIAFSIVETLEHVIVRLRHVNDVFFEALTEENYHARRQKFNNAIKYHVAIIGGCMFVHVLLTGAILGCSGYRVLHSYSPDGMFIFVGWLLAMSVVGVSGQRLMDEALSIGDRIYNLDWHNLDKEIQKDLIMVMMRCQNPVHLHAGPFGYVTYAMIVTVLKTSYSYLTLLSRT